MSYVIEPIDLATIPENAALERFTVAQIKARFPFLAGKKKGTRKGGTKSLQTVPRLASINRHVPMTALQKACEEVANAPEGKRNSEFNQQAFFVAQRLAGGLLNESEHEARQALAEAARQAGLEEGEISATLDSAFKSGLAAPVQSYELAGGHIEYSASSVWFYPEPKKEGDAPKPLLLARQLEVAAKTYDVETGEGGAYLRGKDAYGKALELFIPADLPMNENALAQTLAKARFQLEPLRRQKELLAAHIHKCPCERLQALSSRLGWHDGRYLLPDKCLTPEGSEGEGLTYHSNNALAPAHATSGTLDEWRQQIAAKAGGNSRLILALCTAFAAPLLKPYGVDRGGFLVHLRGGSSTGKTTAANVAASVYGKPSAFSIQWRATSNALEGIAESRNDGLLVLDEVGQASAKDLEPLAYMLANGRGKERSNKNADNRAARYWRNIGLSTGERSYTDIVGEDGKRARTGQELRFLDNEADAGKGHGLFDHLAGHASGADLSQHLNASANRCHGTAGEAFLQCVANEYGQLEADIPTKVKAFVKQVTPQGASGQAERAAAHFGLLAVAGELATKYGITGWQQGEATGAIATCFAAWLEGFGTGNREQQQALNDMRTFLMANAHCAFIEWGTKPLHGVHNLVGHWQEAADRDRHFIIHTEQFNRICKGHDPKNALKALEASGILVRDKKGDLSHAKKLGGKAQRFYLLSWHALGIPVPTAEIGSRFDTAAANEPAKPTADIASTAPASQVQTREAEATASTPTYFAQKPLPLKQQQPAAPNKADSVQTNNSEKWGSFARFNKLDKEAAILACNPTAASLQAQSPLGAITITGKTAGRPIPKAAPPTGQALAENEPPDTELLRQEHLRQILAEATAAEAAHGEI